MQSSETVEQMNIDFVVLRISISEIDFRLCMLIPITNGHDLESVVTPKSLFILFGHFFYDYSLKGKAKVTLFETVLKKLKRGVCTRHNRVTKLKLIKNLCF